MAHLINPNLGQLMQLTQDWKVFISYENERFMRSMHGKNWLWPINYFDRLEVIFPAGTILRLEAVCFKVSSPNNGYAFTVQHHPQYPNLTKKRHLLIHPDSAPDLRFEPLDKIDQSRLEVENHADAISFSEIFIGQVP